MGTSGTGTTTFPAARILVVEDEFLVAMELESMLAACGLTVLGPVSTVVAALALIEREAPDAAVLDVNLRGESVSPVAACLRDRAVPFVLATAYRREDLPEGLRDAVNMGKPVEPKALLAALETLLRPARD